jgi:hypothetical protein
MEMTEMHSPAQTELEPTETLEPPTKADKASKKKSKATKAAKTPRSTDKAKKWPPRWRGKPGNGTIWKTKAGKEYHVMSVHIPTSLLRRLDSQCAKNKTSGKGRSTRSGFAVALLEAKL